MPPAVHEAGFLPLLGLPRIDRNDAVSGRRVPERLPIASGSPLHSLVKKTTLLFVHSVRRPEFWGRGAGSWLLPTLESMELTSWVMIALSFSPFPLLFPSSPSSVTGAFFSLSPS